MLFEELALASRAVAATSKRTEKIAALAHVLRRAAPNEIEAAVAFATGNTLQGRIGVGWATIYDVRPDPASQPTLTIDDVHRAIDSLAAVGGGGSVARRRQRSVDGHDDCVDVGDQTLTVELGGEGGSRAHRPDRV